MDLRNADGHEEKERARHYLLTLLGNGRGLPAKVGQFMSMGNEGQELRQTLNNSIPAMPFEEVRELLETALGQPWKSVFKSIEKKGNPASLGQVHFGRLIDNRDVAVKIQYPDIAAAVEAEMELLGWMPKVGPVAKWGFDMAGYRDVFWNSFSHELDYSHEVENQRRYHSFAAPLQDVVIPQAVAEFCRRNVLVQERVDGIPIEEVQDLPPQQKQEIGRTLVRHYVHMIFRHGFVHSDPHPGNFAFCKSARGALSLVVYDYGSILEIPETVRLGLLRTLVALNERESIDPAACLLALGFDGEKIEDLRPVLPALLQVLFEPFITDAPYDVKHWNLSRRFDAIVGDLKWWFRSAAPPNLIFLMRTLQGLVSMLESLDTKVPWKFILDNLCYDLYEPARALPIPDAPPANGHAPKFDGMARYLKIHVIKPNNNEVKLTMPGRVADDLEGIMDAPVKESIDRQGIDLVEIQKRVIRSGFVPQEVFELKDSERYVRVWME